jgi:putative transposase
LVVESILLESKLFKIHQKTGFEWNQEDHTKGRKVWFNALEHGIKSERHFWATVNYIHHNPVKHSYVEKWQDWPFSSAENYLETVGKEQALKTWQEFNIEDMGNDWDIM